MAVTSRPIVERFDVVGDVLRSGLSVFVNVLLDPFLLETSEERFSNSIVPTVSAATHAGFEMVGFAEPSPSVAAILRSLIGVDQGTIKVTTAAGATVAEVPLVVQVAVEQAGLLGRAWDAIRLWIR